MKTWRSASSIEPTLRAIWKQTRPAKERFKLASTSIEDVISVTRSDNIRNIPEPVTNWLLIFDELLDVIAALYIVYFEGTMRGRKKKKGKVEEIVHMLLLGALASSCFSIRHLVLSGYDMHARALTRLMLEHRDLLILLLRRPELCAEFHAAQEPEDANKFWHRYISRGKLWKDIKLILREQFELDEAEIKQFDARRREEQLFMSNASHASLLGAFFSVAHGGHYGRAGSGPFGNVDRNSVRTVRLCVQELGLALLVGSRLGLYSMLDRKLNPIAKPFVDLLRRKHRFVGSLFFLSLANENDAMLSLAKSA